MELKKVKKKCWWPVASPGFGVRGARRSRRRKREHRRAKGAEWGRVWRGVSPHLPTRRSGERRELLQRGPGGAPIAIAFCIVLGHRMLLVARKIRFSCPDSKSVRKKTGRPIFIWKYPNSTLKKWWWHWQSPPLSKPIFRNLFLKVIHKIGWLHVGPTYLKAGTI